MRVSEERLVQLAVDVPVPASMSQEDKDDWVRMGLAAVKAMETVQELSITDKEFQEAFEEKNIVKLATEMKHYISAFCFLEGVRNTMSKRKKARDAELKQSQSI